MLWTLLSVASRTAAAKQAQLRVVTMNIHAWRDSDHRLNFDRLVAQLRTLNADVVCLNEVLHPFCAPAPDDTYWAEVRAWRHRHHIHHSDHSHHSHQPPQPPQPSHHHHRHRHRHH